MASIGLASLASRSFMWEYCSHTNIVQKEWRAGPLKIFYHLQVISPVSFAFLCGETALYNRLLYLQFYWSTCSCQVSTCLWSSAMTGSVSTSYSIPFLSSFSFLSGHHILLWCCSVQRPPYVCSVTFPLLLNHLFPSTQHRMHWNLIPRHLLLGHTHIDQLTRTLLSPCTKLVVVSPYIYEDNSRISWATQYHPSAPVTA